MWSPEEPNLSNYNFMPNLDFCKFMSGSKFNSIHMFFRYCYADFEKNGKDPWVIMDGIEKF